MIRGLQTRGVFACACVVEVDCIRVGLLVVSDPNLIGRRVTVIDVDNHESAYAIEVPGVRVSRYKINLIYDGIDLSEVLRSADLSRDKIREMF